MFIVDDDPSFLRGIERLLRSCGYATRCYESALDFAADHSPDAVGCVLADLRMPEMDGIALQRHLAKSSNPLPIVFLTGAGDIPTSVEAMRGGAEDFLVKTAAKEAIIDAVERALARDEEERRERRRRRALDKDCEKLTPREREVLRYVLKGLRNKQIAHEMAIDERSVKRHRTNLMAKLGVSSVAELVQFAVEAGLSQPE
ncbi:MAG TPA: DNA-binding response regulator [Chromatiaceae bacterium]|nr:MAG: response regulator transcription factor [Thiohalocapsa sp. PB-PSB1]HBG94103.1 DNA-binding response regulator [Chromatiaceae bacterium]